MLLTNHYVEIQAYVMHYNAPRFYTELKNPTMKRFTVAVEASFGFAALIYIGIASFGFLTFGGHCSSYILNNYSTKDPLATISRLAVGVSSLTTYPIAFIGFRDGVLDVLEVPLEKQTSWNLNALTLVLLTFLTVTALFITDLGFINAVGGGTLATAVVFVFPAIMYRRAAGADNRHHENHGEVAFALALAFVGLVMGVFGVWVAIH
jgi:amino acid permease